MRVVVASFDLKKPLLLSTKEAAAVLIETDDGKPAVVFQLLPDRRSCLRYTKGEDKNFDEIVKQLGLTE